MKLNARVALVVFASIASAAAGAFAQSTIVPPPSGGLFGPTDNRRFHNAMDFSLSIVEGHDSSVQPELRGTDPNETLVGGASTTFLGHMDYRWDGSRVQVAATGESALREYSEAAEFNPLSYSGGLGISARLDGRTTLRANQNAAYSPSYLYGLFPAVVPKTPGATVPIAPDYAVDDSESYNYGTTLTLSRGLSRRSVLSATGDFQYTNFLQEATVRPDLHSTRIRGAFSHHPSPNMAVTVGYSYRAGTFGMDVDAVSTPYASSATEHGVDVGFDYSRPLSATRRASVAFSVSSSIVSPTGSAVDKMDPSQAYRLSGDLAVAWDLSRSWSAHATYRRGLEYIPGFTTPVFANGFTAEIAGLCTSRIDVFASVLYSSGVSVISRDALALDTRSADVRIRYAFTSTLAVYGQYLYYFYDSRGNRLLTPGIPPGLERNAIRAGVTLWVRALRR